MRKFLSGLIVGILIVAFSTYFERKVIGRMQARIGPNRVGPLGLGQPFADVIKGFQVHELLAGKDGHKIGVGLGPDVPLYAHALGLAVHAQHKFLRFTGLSIRDLATTINRNAGIVQREWRLVRHRLRGFLEGVNAERQKGAREINGLHWAIPQTARR